MSKIKRFSDFLGEAKDDLISKLPAQIKTVRDAEKLVLELAKAGKIYHFDDDPHDLSDDPFTKEEADVIEKLMDQAFDVCDKHYSGKHGFWEGLIKGVFTGYIAFTADEEPAGDVYIVHGNGGPGNVRQTTMSDYNELQSTYDEEKGFDETALEKWFNGLKKVK